MSQLDITPIIQEIAQDVPGQGLELIVNLREKVFSTLKVIPYNEETKALEEALRWTRTAHEIFNDGYVFEGKACTDYVIAFLALAKARGFETIFYKVMSDNPRRIRVHSIAGVKVDEAWYTYDIVHNDGSKKGIYRRNRIMRHGYIFWDEGVDSWDIGLRNFKDEEKILLAYNPVRLSPDFMYYPQL